MSWLFFYDTWMSYFPKSSPVLVQKIVLWHPYGGACACNSLSPVSCVFSPQHQLSLFPLLCVFICNIDMPLPQGFHTHCFLPWMFTLINPNISNSKSETFSEPWLLSPLNPESALNIDTICEYWGLRWALLANSCFSLWMFCGAMWPLQNWQA